MPWRRFLFSSAAGLIGGIYTFWKVWNDEEFMALLGTFTPLLPFLLKYLLTFIVVFLGWKLWIGFWRWLPDACQYIYERTKTGRFVALRENVEFLLTRTPLANADSRRVDNESWTIVEQTLLVTLLEQLEDLKVPVPKMDYSATIAEYLGIVLVCMNQGNLERCIEKSKKFREPKDPIRDQYGQPVRPLSWTDF